MSENENNVVKIDGATFREPRENDTPFRALKGRVMKLRDDFEDFKGQSVKSLNSIAEGLSSVANRATATGEQLMRTFSILGDIESRLEALKTLFIRKDVFGEKEYEDTWDEIKGLRVKSKGEMITDGDFLRVTFKAVNVDASVEGAPEVIGEEVDFPVRVGGGHLVIEDELVGRLVGCEPFEVEKKYPNPFPFNAQLAGKTVNFSVSIGRVKTSIQKEKP